MVGLSSSTTYYTFTVLWDIMVGDNERRECLLVKTRMTTLGALLVLVLTLCACTNIAEPSSAFGEGQHSFSINATPGRHQATYTRFVGTYVYKIRLEDGQYDFHFDGSPDLHFELKDRRGENVAELQPSSEVSVNVKAGFYYLAVTHLHENAGAFDITWMTRD